MDRRRIHDDRRRSPRTALVAGVVERGGATTALAQTVDIGTAGVSLVRPAASAPHGPCEPLELEFQLPDGDPIRVAAEVVFDRPYGRFRHAGLRFARMDPRDARRIEALVRSG